MPTPNVLILRAPGTNCDAETAFAFEQAGAKTETLHINRLLEKPALFQQFQILCIPGGFSYGDDLGSGRILGNQMLHHLVDEMLRFKADGKLILGICNGFQVLMKSPVLLDHDAAERPGRHADPQRLRAVSGLLGAIGDARLEMRFSGRHRADVSAGGPCRGQVRRPRRGRFAATGRRRPACVAVRAMPTIPTARWPTWRAFATRPAACWG